MQFQEIIRNILNIKVRVQSNHAKSLAKFFRYIKYISIKDKELIVSLFNVLCLKFLKNLFIPYNRCFGLVCFFNNWKVLFNLVSPTNCLCCSVMTIKFNRNRNMKNLTISAALHTPKACERFIDDIIILPKKYTFQNI